MPSFDSETAFHWLRDTLKKLCCPLLDACRSHGFVRPNVNKKKRGLTNFLSDIRPQRKTNIYSYYNRPGIGNKNIFNMHFVQRFTPGFLFVNVFLHATFLLLNVRRLSIY